MDLRTSENLNIEGGEFPKERLIGEFEQIEFKLICKTND